jgi:hypothetical protein
VPFDRPRLPLSKALINTKKQTVHPGDAFEDTTFKPWVEIVQF